MRIKITRSTNQASWYKHRVGEIYTVLDKKNIAHPKALPIMAYEVDIQALKNTGQLPEHVVTAYVRLTDCEACPEPGQEPDK